MLSSDSINAQLKDNSHVISGMGIKRIGLFGSFLRGGEHPHSDIDILVEFRKGEEKYKNLLKLHEYLTDLFQRRIEIVTMGGLSPCIGPHILKEVRFVETT